MVTDAQNQANLGSAAGLAATTVGLDLTAVPNWSQSDRISYLQELSQTILGYPDEFNDQTLAIAQGVASADFSSMSLVAVPTDSSFDDSFWDQFWANFGNNALQAGGDIVSIGNGAENLLNGAGNLITGAGTALSGAGQAIANVGSVSTWAAPVAALLLLVMLTQSTATKVSQQKYLR